MPVPPDPPDNPFRVGSRSGFAGAPLTQPQQRVLAALVALCPQSGSETDARAVAEATQIRLGSVVVVLRSLEKRRLAVAHPAEPDGPAETWSPTMEGHSRVRHFRPADEQPAAEREPDEDPE